MEERGAPDWKTEVNTASKVNTIENRPRAGNCQWI